MIYKPEVFSDALVAAKAQLDIANQDAKIWGQVMMNMHVEYVKAQAEYKDAGDRAHALNLLILDLKTLLGVKE